MSWLYSQALVEEYSAANCLDGEQSAPLNGSHTQQAYCAPDKMTAFSRLSRYGMTFKPLMESPGQELLTLYLAGFHAKTSQLQETETDLTESDQECGEKWHGLLAKFAPATHSWRTVQCSLLEDLNESLATLPRSGMTRDGRLWELPMLAQTTKETEFGLLENWPTPRSCSAMAATITPESAWDKKRNPNLETVVGKSLWPTPAARDGKPTNTLETLMDGRFVDQLANRVKMVETNLWATPTARDWRGHTITPKFPNGFNKNLVNDVLKFPTPQASDYRDRGNMSNPSIQRRAEKGKQLNLSMVAHPTSGQLNPTWVEWLMGWPLGWTDLKPLETDKSHCVQQQHGGS
jgi:hypothetical protein